MTLGLTPLFVGPTAFLVVTLLVILLVLAVAHLVFRLAWRLILVAAIVLLGLWLLGAIGSVTPGMGP